MPLSDQERRSLEWEYEAAKNNISNRRRNGETSPYVMQKEQDKVDMIRKALVLDDQERAGGSTRPLQTMDVVNAAKRGTQPQGLFVANSTVSPGQFNPGSVDTRNQPPPVAPAPVSQQSSQDAFQAKLDAVRKARDEELARGRARADELFGEGILGRVDETRSPEVARLLAERRSALDSISTDRSPEVARLLAERRAALEGVQTGRSPELERLIAERAAERDRLLEGRNQELTDLSTVQRTQLRERALGGLSEQSQSALARTRAILGRQGRDLQDPSAAAQQRRILEQELKQGAQIERDLQLSEIERRDRLRNELENLTLSSRRDLEGLVGGARAEERANLDRADRLRGDLEALTERARSEEFAQQARADRLRSELEGLTGAAEASELARQQINAERQARELAGRLQTEFGFAGLGTAERFGLAQLEAAEQERLAAQEFQRESLRLQEKAIDKPDPAPPSGGGKIICGELYRQGLLDLDTYIADLAYAKTIPQYTIDGYHWWAHTVVGWMQRSPLVTKLVVPIARGWATEMAWRMRRDSSGGSWVGKILTVTAEPICYMLGMLKRFIGAN